MPEHNEPFREGPDPRAVTVPGAFRIRYTMEHNVADGFTRCTVSSTAVQGVFVLVPYLGESMSSWNGPTPFQLDTGRLAILCGDGPPHENLLWPPHDVEEYRPHRPIVNGTRITGAYTLDIADARHGTDRPMTATALRQRMRASDGTSASRATANHATCVMAALTRFWADQPAPDLDRLRRAAALRRAMGWLTHLDDTLADLRRAENNLSHAVRTVTNEHRTCLPLVRHLLDLQHHDDQDPATAATGG
jgi:hypothetical protein